MMVLAKAADQVGFGDELELLVLVHNATTRWKGGGEGGDGRVFLSWIDHVH